MTSRIQMNRSSTLPRLFGVPYWSLVAMGQAEGQERRQLYRRVRGCAAAEARVMAPMA